MTATIEALVQFPVASTNDHFNLEYLRNDRHLVQHIVGHFVGIDSISHDVGNDIQVVPFKIVQFLAFECNHYTVEVLAVLILKISKTIHSEALENKLAWRNNIQGVSLKKK